jgi:hypothetical protein
LWISRTFFRFIVDQVEIGKITSSSIFRISYPRRCQLLIHVFQKWHLCHFWWKSLVWKRWKNAFFVTFGAITGVWTPDSGAKIEINSYSLKFRQFHRFSQNIKHFRYIKDYTSVWITYWLKSHDCQLILGIVWFDWSLYFLTSQLWRLANIHTKV